MRPIVAASRLSAYVYTMVATGWMARARRALAAALLATTTLDCAIEVEDGDDDAGDRGIVFNGIVFNGVNLDGGVLDETRVHTPAYDGVYGASAPVYNVQLDPGSNRYTGWLGGSELLAGADFVGVEQRLTLNAGGVDEEDFILRVDGVHESEDFSGVYLLDLRYRPIGGATWSSPCVDEDETPTRAVLMHGRYDEQLNRTHAYNDTHNVTLACEGSVIGKCIAAGYASWVDQTMADLHQACARMVYADYCGSGQPNTVNGTAIDIEDHLGIQTFETDWPVEAAWDRNGALCLNAPRVADANPSCSLQPCTAEDLASATLISKALPGE